MIDLHAIARHYGGTVLSGHVVIPTPGHSTRDRGTSIKLAATAPDGMLVHCYNGSGSDALAVKDMLRRDGFLPTSEHNRPRSLKDAGRTSNHLPDADVEAERQRSISKAKAVWRSTIPAAGSMAETYLRFRGISPPYSPDIRFQRLPYDYMGQLPCLVAAVRDVTGNITGVHRIWLASDGKGKAKVAQPKRSLGIIKGGAIRLGDLRCGSTMIVCEGLEDGLSLAAMLREPCMVATGTSFLSSMQFPFGVRTIVIGSDSDAPGEVAARNAALAFAERGKAVRIIRPLEGFKDFNDELRGHTDDH